ncbi:MAG: cytochrome c [Sulfurovaceae bacterium]|nr:cytochrome c [Sulfurovaceae bacterium]
MKKIQLLFLPILALSAEDFMSNYEYGQMLYNNPRGISCAKCHGEKGEGKFIGQYYKKDKKLKKIVLQEIHSSNINTKTIEQIKVSVSKTHDVMPTYSLTDKEVQAIYEYLQKIKNKK